MEDSKQEKRDKLKDRILEKYNIPLVRLKTNGSGEYDILKKEIEKNFN